MSVNLDSTENIINAGGFENVFCRILVSWSVMLLCLVSGSRLFERTYHLSIHVSRSMTHFRCKNYRCMRQ